MQIDLPCRPWLAIALAISTVMLSIFFLLTGGEETTWLWRESGPIEDASAALYIFGACFALWACRYVKGRLRFYLVSWALFCVVCFGEETSWLQHQLGYATPDALLSRNAQGEFNLHNLDAFHGGALLGNESGFSPKTLLKSQHVFQFGFFVFFLLIPLAARTQQFHSLLRKLQFPFPNARFAIYVWIPIGVSIVCTFLSSGQTKSAIAETREMFYALTIASFLLLALITIRSGAATDSRLQRRVD